jgi:hypothetical protein
MGREFPDVVHERLLQVQRRAGTPVLVNKIVVAKE